MKISAEFSSMNDNIYVYQLLHRMLNMPFVTHFFRLISTNKYECFTHFFVNFDYDMCLASLV